MAETLTQDIDEAHEVFERLVRLASTTTTPAPCWRRKASRSSPTRSPSCWRGSRPNAASSSLHERGRGPRRADLGARRDRLDRRRSAVAGWLDEPFRELDLSAAPVGDYEHYVLLGMEARASRPRSSDAASARRTSRSRYDAPRRSAGCRTRSTSADLLRRVVQVGVDARDALAPRARGVGRTEPRAIRGRHRSRFGSRAQQERDSAVFHGEPAIGGRYSALSAFGSPAAALIGADVERIRTRAREMAEACRAAQDNSGLQLALRPGDGWKVGRDKICIEDNRRLRPVGRAAHRRVDGEGRQGSRSRPGRVAGGPTASGPRSSSATRTTSGPSSSAGSSRPRSRAPSCIDAFNQPDVQSADRTNQILGSGEDPDVAPQGSLDELLDGAQEGNYVRPGLRRPHG